MASETVSPLETVSIAPRSGHAASHSDELTAYLTAKRVFDLSFSYLVLVFAAPILLFIAASIKATSPGPILFRQVRLGRNGRPFSVFKFRTMVIDAEARLKELEAKNESSGGILFKMRRDPRITPIGRFLRKSSLDELPQLFNVLRGEMSLVGPRPLPLRDLELLKQADPAGFVRRHEAMPGLTGLWQIGGRSDVGHESMVRLDLEYVDRRSMLLDFKIIYKTIGVVLLGRGAC